MGLGGYWWLVLELRNNGRVALAGHIANITAVQGVFARVRRAKPRCETDDGETDESSDGSRCLQSFPSGSAFDVELCAMRAVLFCFFQMRSFISQICLVTSFTRLQVDTTFGLQ